MPASCAPEVSPAVVRLEPLGPTSSHLTGPKGPVTIDQRGLRFEPRVAACQLGQPVRFGNGDAETHGIHIMANGTNFNQGVAAGQSIEFTPERPGVYQVLCDVHSHMRAYLVVGGSPWVAACARNGRFQFTDVPAGRYRLIVWHEMGDPVEQEVDVAPSGLDLGTIVVTARPGASLGASLGPVEPWSDVIDRVGLTLARSLDAAFRVDGRDRAVTLAQDAYFEHYEASDMETAVRSYLGMGRNASLESQFRKFARTVAQGPAARTAATEQSRALMIALAGAGNDLKAKGITDRSKVLSKIGEPDVLEGPDASGAFASHLVALSEAFAKARALTESGRRTEAAFVLSDEGYFEAFEPIERALQVREPGSVKPLEASFNTIRGEILQGMEGAALAQRLDALEAEVVAAVGRITSEPSGRFGVAFVGSLGVLLREGIEVILLLTMLFALVAKAGRPDLCPALRWGVGLAVVASGLTALGLHWLLGSAAGRTQELLEGVVLLTASGVLFYVSYWLISQSESQRWLAFLKRQTERGASRGAAWALGLTAFLAIYREGAEVVLMYQSMISMNQGVRQGLLGIVAGLAVGLPILGVVYWLVRKSSVRLPMKTFFQVTGVFLFALAVVFAGHAVFELQSSQIIRTTAVGWMGDGLPLLGVYPNIQCLSVQGVLLVGAGVAIVMQVLGTDRHETPEGRPTRSPRGVTPLPGN